MKLEFDPRDLRPEFQTKDDRGLDQGINTSQINFEHLNDQSQATLLSAGYGVFWAYDCKTHKAIMSPK